MYINTINKIKLLIIFLIFIVSIYKLLFTYTIQDLFEKAIRYDNKILYPQSSALIQIRNIEKQIYSKGTESIEYLVSMLNTSEVATRKNLIERMNYTYNNIYNIIHKFIYRKEIQHLNYSLGQITIYYLGHKRIAYEILDNIDTDEVVNYIRSKMNLNYDESSQKYLICLLSKSNYIIDIDKLISYISVDISDNIAECAHRQLKIKLLSLGINDVPGSEIYNIKICQDPYCHVPNNYNNRCSLPHSMPSDSLKIAIIKTHEWWLKNRSTVESLLNRSVLIK